MTMMCCRLLGLCSRSFWCSKGSRQQGSLGIVPAFGLVGAHAPSVAKICFCFRVRLRCGWAPQVQERSRQGAGAGVVEGVVFCRQWEPPRIESPSMCVGHEWHPHSVGCVGAPVPPAHTSAVYGTRIWPAFVCAGAHSSRCRDGCREHSVSLLFFLCSGCVVLCCVLYLLHC